MEPVVAFAEELAAAGVGPLASGAADLGPRLTALVARGAAAHPALAVEEERFVRHLARCVAGAGLESLPRLEDLEVEDLYLAHACATGIPGAAAAFEARCGAKIRTVLSATAKSGDLRAEVEQRVRDLLLVGTAETPAKIRNYSGQGPLDRWVAVVVQRQVITMLRADETEQRARDGAALEAAVATAQPELAYAKQRYRAEFERAMTEALAALGERERLLLRLHLISGLSVESIGKMYGVSQSTASRWLADARGAVAAGVERLLHERLRVSPDELASLAGLVASQLDLSMSRLLKPSV